MQVYCSLSLKDNSELFEEVLGRCSIPVSVPVPSSSQTKKQTYSLQWVLLAEDDLVISPTCEEESRRFDSQKNQLQKGLEWSCL